MYPSPVLHGGRICVKEKKSRSRIFGILVESSQKIAVSHVTGFTADPLVRLWKLIASK